VQESGETKNDDESNGSGKVTEDSEETDARHSESTEAAAQDEDTKTKQEEEEVADKNDDE